MYEGLRPLAYSGKYVTHKDKKYFLTPEISQGGCKGCDLIEQPLGCTKSVTDLCRQGYILKAVKW